MFLHGHNRRGRRTATYQTWVLMHRRCEDPKCTQWKWYGAKGVKVAERWKSYENFLADVGKRPSGMTLDRFPDRDGNYEPGNVRWATHTDQVRGNSHTKLTVELAAAIRSATGSNASIARAFGCHPSTVSKIKLGKYWR